MIIAIRTIITWIVGVPTVIVFSILTFLASLVDKTGNLAHVAASTWMKIVLFAAGVRVEVLGVENIPNRPVILAANHTGTFDIPVVQGKIPLQFRWVAKKSLFSIPFLGWAMSRSGYVPVDLENPKHSLASIKNAAKKIKNGTSVLIFPEGTRNTTGKLLPFKRGAFLLATQSGVPIVPVSITGTRDIMRINGFVVRPANVRIVIGKPIESEGKKSALLTDETFRAIEEGLK